MGRRGYDYLHRQHVRYGKLGHSRNIWSCSSPSTRGANGQGHWACVPRHCAAQQSPRFRKEAGYDVAVSPNWEVKIKKAPCPCTPAGCLCMGSRLASIIIFAGALKSVQALQYLQFRRIGKILPIRNKVATAGRSLEASLLSEIHLGLEEML